MECIVCTRETQIECVFVRERERETEKEGEKTCVYEDWRERERELKS